MEPCLYQDAEGVTVTKARFVVGQAMYPVRNITSVETAENHTPANRLWAMLVGLAAVGSLMQATMVEEPVRVVIFLTLPLAALTVFLWRRAKPTYQWIVRIHTAGVQKDAVVTADKDRRDQIVTALHQATAGG